MGDSINNSQFDFDEDAVVATSTAIEELSGTDDEEFVEEVVDAAKLRKKEIKKRKFAEMKEKMKSKKLKTDPSDVPSAESEAGEATAAAASAVAVAVAESYELLRSALRSTRFRESVIPADMMYIPKALSKSDTSQKCPFFSTIQTKIPDFQTKKKTPGSEVGSPLVIIVSAGAVRSVEIMRHLSTSAQCRIAKLFAKHIKVEEQVDMLREYNPIAVGTPNRLNKLVDIGALTLSNTKLILIDMAADEKSYTLLNSPNVKEDFFKFLVENVFPHSSDIQLALIK
jgi:protein CMS1